MSNLSVCNISHDLCTGCKMCGDICNKNAVSFAIEEGFWYPVIDKDLCVNCGLCAKKCPVLNKTIQVTSPYACYGARSKDDTIRWESTSGGFFSELAKQVIVENGYCIGAVYSKNNEIVHKYGNNYDDIDAMRQSKYAQSDTTGIYRSAKQILEKDILLLFCGCACHVEALKSYLGKDYDNLLTMDFICLGICSPVVYRKYLDFWENKHRSKISRVWFKNKKFGWNRIGVRLEFENGDVYMRPGGQDMFMIAFVGDTIAIRKSCETCKFRKVPHNSDLTVADFWGIENVQPEIDDNLGWSAVFANTEKGNRWFEKVSKNLYYFETTQEKITNGNFSALRAKTAGACRDKFLNAIEYMPFDKALRKYGNSYSYMTQIKLAVLDVLRNKK